MREKYNNCGAIREQPSLLLKELNKSKKKKKHLLKIFLKNILLFHNAEVPKLCAAAPREPRSLHRCAANLDN